MVSDRDLAYGDLKSVDEVYMDGDQVAAAAGAVGAFGKKLPRQATSIVVLGTQPFNLSLTDAAPPAVATAGVPLIPASTAVRIGVELDHDATVQVANVSAGAGNFTLLIFRRRRRQPRLPGQA